MGKYDKLREDLYQINISVAQVIASLEAYESMPTPSHQIQLDVQISSTEIFMQNMANDIRKRLLV